MTVAPCLEGAVSPTNPNIRVFTWRRNTSTKRDVGGKGYLCTLGVALFLYGSKIVGGVLRGFFIKSSTAGNFDFKEELVTECCPSSPGAEPTPAFAVANNSGYSIDTGLVTSRRTKNVRC